MTAEQQRGVTILCLIWAIAATAGLVYYRDQAQKLQSQIDLKIPVPKPWWGDTNKKSAAADCCGCCEGAPCTCRGQCKCKKAEAPARTKAPRVESTDGAGFATFVEYALFQDPPTGVYRPAPEQPGVTQYGPGPAYGHPDSAGRWPLPSPNWPQPNWDINPFRVFLPPIERIATAVEHAGGTVESSWTTTINWIAVAGVAVVVALGMNILHTNNLARSKVPRMS
jgi:hypothetical protein